MTRVAFLADLHVDTYGSRIDPDTGLNARLVDYLATLRWIANDAAERDCDVLVVAGDFTERRHCPSWLAALIRDALREGPATQLYVRGNHDAELGERSIVDVLADRSHRFGYRMPGVHLAHDVIFTILPFADRHFLRATELATADEATVRRTVADRLVAVARGIYASQRTDLGVTAHVLVLHQTIAGAAFSDAQRAYLGDADTVVDGTALASIGFDLIVAGHLHRHQVVPTGGPTPVVYPGSIERVDFGEQDDPKGYVVADLERGATTWEFVESPATRRYVTLPFHMLDAPRQPDVRDAIVRVRDVPRDVEVDDVRRLLLDQGAFDVYSIEREPAAPAVAGGLPETLTPEQATEAYFAEHPDREALIDRARPILLEAADRTR